MSEFNQARATKRFKIDGSDSVTLFASVTASRWVLTGGFIGWAQASVSSIFSLIETWDSVSTVFFRWNSSITTRVCDFYLGPHGIQASAEYSGLKLAVDVNTAATGSYTGAFSGYYTGGG